MALQAGGPLRWAGAMTFDAETRRLMYRGFVLQQGSSLSQGAVVVGDHVLVVLRENPERCVTCTIEGCWQPTDSQHKFGTFSILPALADTGGRAVADIPPEKRDRIDVPLSQVVGRVVLEDLDTHPEACVHCALTRPLKTHVAIASSRILGQDVVSARAAVTSQRKDSEQKVIKCARAVKHIRQRCEAFCGNCSVFTLDSGIESADVKPALLRAGECTFADLVNADYGELRRRFPAVADVFEPAPRPEKLHRSEASTSDEVTEIRARAAKVVKFVEAAAERHTTASRQASPERNPDESTTVAPSDRSLVFTHASWMAAGLDASRLRLSATPST